ncbi:MAG: hypothetical protein HDR01_03545 [Lachnospiraceae bacterium]|nr:hypothetical protein [Lachnospiraceae bacterium]
MAMTRQELIQFLDGLVELASEENKAKAVLVKERFISDFEKSYEYEKEVSDGSSESEPKYAVTAILDRKSGELLYDEEADFVECVHHWLEEKISIAELEKERCSVEGIEVREYGKSIPIRRSGRSRQ